jgi:hypothetical protein
MRPCQIRATGTLLDLGAHKGSGGRAVAVIDILDDIARPSDPLGVQRRRGDLYSLFPWRWHLVASKSKGK